MAKKKRTPTLTKEQKRAERCDKDIEAALKKHRCKLKSVVFMRPDGTIGSGIKIIPKD